MKLLRHLPNALTSGNLICGCLGLIWVTHHPSGPEAAYFVWAACIFDFLDGFAARMLKVSSPLGKELDSLADMVSFGVLPSFAMFQMISDAHDHPYAVSYVALMLAVFSALRLARFNIDENQKDSFIGVPTPAAALLITGLPMLPDPAGQIVDHGALLVTITIAVSFLMVSPFELFALKFKNFSWSDNKLRFTFLALAVLLLAGWQAGAISLIILLYIIVSLASRAFGFK